MSNLREPLASTSLASLEWSEGRERAVDRVAASGRVNGLWLALWKAKYMLEVRAHRSAINGLETHYRDRYKAERPEIATKIVLQIIREYIASFCVDCGGVRELLINDLKVTCVTCKGTGVRFYSDFDRARSMKLSLNHVRVLTHKLNWLQDEVRAMDRAVNSVMNSELEREL